MQARHFILTLGTFACALARSCIKAMMKFEDSDDRYNAASGEFLSRVVPRLAQNQAWVSCQYWFPS